MFEKTEKAITDLASAVTEDVTTGISVAKAAVIPAISGVFGAVKTAAGTAEAAVKDGSFWDGVFGKAKDLREKAAAAVKPTATPGEADFKAAGAAGQGALTDEKIAAIKALIAVGQTDAVIAATVNVDQAVIALFRTDGQA